MLRRRSAVTGRRSVRRIGMALIVSGVIFSLACGFFLGVALLARHKHPVMLVPAAVAAVLGAGGIVPGLYIYKKETGTLIYKDGRTRYSLWTLARPDPILLCGRGLFIFWTRHNIVITWSTRGLQHSQLGCIIFGRCHCRSCPLFAGLLSSGSLLEAMGHPIGDDARYESCSRRTEDQKGVAKGSQVRSSVTGRPPEGPLGEIATMCARWRVRPRQAEKIFSSPQCFDILTGANDQPRPPGGSGADLSISRKAMRLLGKWLRWRCKDFDRSADTMTETSPPKPTHLTRGR